MTKRLLMLLTLTPSLAFANAVWTQLGGMSSVEVPLIEADWMNLTDVEGEQRDDVRSEEHLRDELDAPDEALTD